MQTKNKIKIIIAIIAGITLLTVGGGLTYLLNRLFHLEDYKKEILAQVEKGLKTPVSYDKGSFSLRYGPSFSFTKVTVGDSPGGEPLLAADRLTVKVALLPLLSGNVILKDLLINHPTVNIVRFPDGKFNTSDLTSGTGEESLQVKGIKLKHAYVKFTDETIPGKLVTVLEDLDFALDGLKRGDRSAVKASALVVTQGGKGIITISGVIQLSEPNEPWSGTYLNGRILAKDLDAHHFWPYYRAYVPFESISAQFGISSHIKGRLDSFTSKGSITASDVRFSWPSVFNSTLSPQEVHLSYDMGITSDDVSIKTFDATVDGIKVKGSFKLKDRLSDDPRIIAKAKTSPMRLSYVKPFIPFGIIPKDTSDFIDKKITNGFYTIENGTLDGHISQIANMGIGNNFNVLSVTGTVDQGAVSLGADIPAFTKIVGNLELTGKDFILKDISAYFGLSPLTLEGKIAGFSTSSHATYPFSAEFSPMEPEVAWLVRQLHGQKLSFTGDSKLKLIGTGSSNDYRLSGDWDLTSASYKYDNVISKTEKLQNMVSFQAALTADEVSISDLRYDCYPLSMNIGASYSFADKRIKVGIKSNDFLLQDAAPVFPIVKNYQFRGRFAGAIQGEGRTSDKVAWKGKISLGNLSFKPTGTKPITNMTGDITFRGEAMETSLLTGKIGNSLIKCRGSVSDLSRPVVSIIFSSPELDPADIGLSNTPPGFTIKKVQGDIGYGNGFFQIKSLSSQINGSPIAITGSIELDSFRQPALDIAISSPHIVIDDILPLTQINLASSPAGGGIRHVKASINVNEGSFHAVPFKKLQSRIFYQNNILSITDFFLSSLGGKISGAGLYDNSKGIPAYRLTINAESLAISQISPVIHAEGNILTGIASFSGDLTGTGASLAELKKSLAGELAITLEKGTLQQFPVLSKVFSILNVSQLFKLQLPDMVSGGMPFNKINGHFSIRDGVASTSDLYVDSNAMNISIVGSASLVKKEIDLAIGLQPLQTVDKVVNHIPIVGWILTGKDRSLVTAYFEAKGPWNDPVVQAFPVQSMARGVFDIFKRVFQLPGKLVTDTGEVIIGR